jgi:hypothetical protein
VDFSPEALLLSMGESTNPNLVRVAARPVYELETEGLEVKEFRKVPVTIGMDRVWDPTGFPGKRAVGLWDFVRVADLPSGKYLGVEIGPVGDFPVSHVMCPCGTYRTEVLKTTNSYQ